MGGGFGLCVGRNVGTGVGGGVGVGVATDADKDVGTGVGGNNGVFERFARVNAYGWCCWVWIKGDNDNDDPLSFLESSQRL